MKCLSRRGMWPTSNIQTYSVHDVSYAFESFPNLEYYMPHKLNLKDQLSKAVGDVNNEVKGLCLSCVKHVASTEKDGNCHAELECNRLVTKQNISDVPGLPFNNSIERSGLYTLAIRTV